MEDKVEHPLEDGDLKAVAAAMTKLAKMSPDPEWNTGANGFAAIAEAGAAAAKSGDEAALRQTCKSCHKAFRRDYKAKFRLRPVP